MLMEAIRVLIWGSLLEVVCENTEEDHKIPEVGDVSLRCKNRGFQESES